MSWIWNAQKLIYAVAKTLGKNLLSQGIGLAQGVAADALSGKNIKRSIIDQGKARALDFGKNVAKHSLGALAGMVGKGGRRAPRRRRRKVARRRKSIRRRQVSRKRVSRKRVSSKPASRKRRAPSKSSRKAKRRRVNF